MNGIQVQKGAAGELSLFLPLQKIDPDQRMVYGYATTDGKDMEGETITLSAIEDALPGYMRFANLREMHQLSAVGVTKQASIDDRGLYIGGKIVDDAAWEKVKEGVYKGFSIGGTATMRDPANPLVITGLDLIEVSLVDRPCNPECLIEVFKGGKLVDAVMKAPDPRRPVQKWDCGVVGHNHIGKAEAQECINKTTNLTSETISLRDRLIKAVDALDRDGLQSAVSALAKAEMEDNPGEGEKQVPDDVPMGTAPAEEPEHIEGPPADLDKVEADKEAVPKVGDIVLFTNDKHTDKGPSDGHIVEVEGDDCYVDHSDVKKDKFDLKSLGAEFKINEKGQRIWLVKCTIDKAMGSPDEVLVSVGAKLWKTTLAPREAPVAEEPKPVELAKAEDNKDGKEGDYGSAKDAGYADPGHQADGKPRYPLKEGGKYSEGRIRAAWNYINKPKNQSAYSADQVKSIKDKIIAAWKEAIDKDGPPSASDDGKTKAETPKSEDSKVDRELITKLGPADAKEGFNKGLTAACTAIYLLEGLDTLRRTLAREAAVEGDESSIPSRVGNVVALFSDVVQGLLDEEVEEMLSNKEIGSMDYASAGSIMYAAGAVNMLKARGGVKKVGERLTKALGDRTGDPNYENLSKAVEDLIKKGQDEWEAANPPDTQGDNDDWTQAKPADDQGSNDAWTKRMKKAAQDFHDKAVKMGAECHAEKVDKAKKADGEDGKNPPAPDAGNDKDMKGKEDSKKPADNEDETNEAPDDETDEAKKSKKAAKPAEDLKVLDVLEALQKRMEEIAERVNAGRNPPKPGATRVVDKANDIGLDEEKQVRKAITPSTATDEDRAEALRKAMSTPHFVPRFGA